jgi:hypothetical protein
VLDLSGNQLSCISKRTLSNLPLSLVEINLSKNKIVDIESGAFRDLASLRSLNLAWNNFASLNLNNILSRDTVNLLFLDIQSDVNIPIVSHESSPQKQEANMTIKGNKIQEISNLPVAKCSRSFATVKVSSEQREANRVVFE